MIKVLRTLGIEIINLKIIKSMNNKPIANIILNGKAENISSKIKNETTILPSFSVQILRYSNLIRERQRQLQIRKEVFILPLFTDGMTLY